MKLPLFCFGSLMDRDMLACVVGPATNNVKMITASIVDYYKARLPHESYPMLVSGAGREAPGKLLYGLSMEDLDRILFFEGDEYELTPCKVRLEDGQWAAALFFDEGVMPPPSVEEWDFEYWQSHHKDYMLRRTKVYMSCYGDLSAEEADKYWQNYRE